MNTTDLALRWRSYRKGGVCAQYGHLVLKVSNYSRGCKSLTGELVKPVSKPQAGSS
ncbi:hypothetical protein [Pontibacter sp. SGAir0037]|uniref:hypothetical protein n=1 Tax=Pontibacter sp. SGAir0037 TaxID=2571030 RepID=UPI00143DE395|nr:hypothetical protein [Pontibacter sp. SGAir0037]